MEIGPPKNRSNRRIKIHKRENDLKRFQNGTFLAEMRKVCFESEIFAEMVSSCKKSVETFAPNFR